MRKSFVSAEGKIERLIPSGQARLFGSHLPYLCVATAPTLQLWSEIDSIDGKCDKGDVKLE